MEKQDLIQAKTIITSHINSDYDAIGAMLAAQLLYPDAVIIFPGSQEKNLRNFFVSSMSYMFNMASLDEIDESKIETIVLVDTRQKTRIPHIDHLLDKEEIKFHIYDHHPPQGEEIPASFMEYKPYGATTTILSEQIMARGILPSPEEATIMALGIYEDTGNFTHTSTSPEDFTQAAFLLSAGANLSTVVSMVVKEIKTEHVTWMNELLIQMRSQNINGTDVHISSISSPTYIHDLSAIVQKIMRMEDLDIFVAIALMGNKITLIARNKIPEVNVGKVMSSFGGGGHAYAASATVDGLTLAQAEHLLFEKLEKELKRIQVARALMASPALTIDPSISCEKAGQLMTRYNISTLLVVDRKTNSYEGYITRRVVEKILYHQLKSQPVEEYMHAKTGFVTPDATIAEIDQKLIEEKHRIIPVIEDGWIKGVITQTDLLNYLVQHNKASVQTDAADHPHAKTRDVGKTMNQQLDYHLLALLENIGKAGAEFGVNTYAVGGFVRDLMLHRIIDDIDIVVEGDGIAFAKYFAKKMGCRANPHKKFGTAVIIFDDNFKVDVASARLEYYTTPAALPIVEQSSLKMDLARRD
ncbi:MAG: CBS domain-containing protein, partial [Desulfovibrionales bacterium]|nr:CBS domain-containing protein [Desulfovibrionales bacterium]